MDYVPVRFDIQEYVENSSLLSLMGQAEIITFEHLVDGERKKVSVDPRTILRIRHMLDGFAGAIAAIDAMRGSRP